MQSAGEMLARQRLDKKLTYTQVSQLTKIPVGVLKNLEKSRFASLPDYAFLKGMVRNYAQALGLDADRTVAVFKRDYDQKQTSQPLIGRRSVEPGRFSRLLEKPQTLFLTGVVLALVLIFWALWRAYQPPRLIINAPVDGQTAISPVDIAGRTDRDASLSLNGTTLNLNPDGSFATTFENDPGSYELNFRAVSRRQKTTEKTIRIVIID